MGKTLVQRIVGLFSKEVPVKQESVKAPIVQVVVPDLRSRVIVTGGYHYDWGTHYVDYLRYDIPKDVTRISVGSTASHRIDLELVKRDGEFYQPSSMDATRQIELQYPPKHHPVMSIDRLTSLAVEDGRLYHDVSLNAPVPSLGADGAPVYDEHSKRCLPSNGHRLHAFLRGVEKDYGADWFKVMYDEWENPK